jgi:2-polyprenyl-6-methoxyphenol hydroxylase-like FAD-dependent oxidoreductase
VAVKLREVIVIGAGIGGLATAIALQRLGLEVTVYEKAPVLGEVGAGITLWTNAIKALRKLGVSETGLEGARVSRTELLNTRGEIIKSMNVGDLEQAFGAPTIAVHRANLQHALINLLQPNTLRLGAVCTGFTQDNTGVEAHFADGSTVPGDLLIGADGIHSIIRQVLVPQVALRYSGYIAWRGVVNYPDPVAHDRTTESWGCGSRFGIVPIDANRIYWFATANLPSGLNPTPAERKEELNRRFKGWHAPVEALIQATPDDAILYNDIVDFSPAQPWSGGSVALLGDAIHPTTPNMGQGACQALESSVILARCLAEETDLTAALQRYESERSPRTSWITNQSWTVGRYGQIQSGFLCSIREFVMRRILPDSFFLNPLRKAIGYEA